MQYRKARLDEVQEVAQVCADAFEDYPYLSMIASNLKNCLSLAGSVGAFGD